MNRGARLLIGTLLGAFFSLAAFAQESGAYLGGALGQAKFKEWCDTSGAPAGFVLLACEDTDTAWKLFGGYRFNRYVAIEATLRQLGQGHRDRRRADGRFGRAEQYGNRRGG